MHEYLRRISFNQVDFENDREDCIFFKRWGYIKLLYCRDQEKINIISGRSYIIKAEISLQFVLQQIGSNYIHFHRSQMHNINFIISDIGILAVKENISNNNFSILSMLCFRRDKKIEITSYLENTGKLHPRYVRLFTQKGFDEPKGIYNNIRTEYRKARKELLASQSIKEEIVEMKDLLTEPTISFKSINEMNNYTDSTKEELIESY